MNKNPAPSTSHAAQEHTGDGLPTSTAVVPLFVDLDETLLATDLVWEGFTKGLSERPALALASLLDLARGRAAWKTRLAEIAKFDVELLPVREAVLDFISEQRRLGRPIVLATASPADWAQRLAEEIGLFDDVLASSATHNLKGNAKLAAIEQWCRHRGFDGFDYIGDCRADQPIWQAARTAHVVAPTPQLERQLKLAGIDYDAIGVAEHRWRPLLATLRPRQWAKNLLVLLPLLLAHRLTDWPALLLAIVAFVAFSCCASAVYVLNDLLDLQADRRHPSKRMRPFAAGNLPLRWAPALAFGLPAVGIGMAVAWLPWSFAWLVGLYLLIGTLYSCLIKRQMMLDVVTLAGLYAIRIFAGGAATGVEVSEWLLAFSMFFFMSLAFAKRHAELARLESEGRRSAQNRGYRVSDLGVLENLGATCGCVSVLVLAMYVHQNPMSDLYPKPWALWIICPLLLYWIGRIWILARRRELHEDPLVFASRDLVSWLIASLITVLAVVASLG